jgi:hypothetical protein
MLVDLPLHVSMTTMWGELWTPEKLDQGVYRGHLNAILDIRSLVKTEYPFSDVQREYFANWRENWANNGIDEAPSMPYADGPYDFGVCDNYQQILDQFPMLLTDPRHFQIWLTQLHRKDEPAEGGWRWHKWGPYIGTQEPQYEYLYDEKHIDQVEIFKVIEVVY